MSVDLNSSLILMIFQIPKILEWPPAREFLSIDDQRNVIPIYDNEPIDEQPEATVTEGDSGRENRVNLGSTEKETAKISDLDLLKVIGKGSFGKVHRYTCSCLINSCENILME